MRLWLALWLMVPLALAFGEERIYRGKWDGSAIEVRLKIDERTRRVTGYVCRGGEPSDVIASLQGQSFADGSMELHLTYRFEDYGIYVVRPGQNGDTQIWQTASKDLWFRLSD